ncbi:hypothetical protein NEOLEDRAFT_778237 [Neolentinus lepideus HHB14362 ss-1]|uniref:Uncharacterized protein n=1 Tax=Neolentinus lepideus HHB14362 ss-1 TaxID=1314782 RepID=A0A165UVT2_9AGAM|nr:hypothetical protein NEOLEDRAFT_778237 [Neolentinus lepideus HHB14362 ss-1]
MQAALERQESGLTEGLKDWTCLAGVQMAPSSQHLPFTLSPTHSNANVLILPIFPILIIHVFIVRVPLIFVLVVRIVEVVILIDL